MNQQNNHSTHKNIMRYMLRATDSFALSYRRIQHEWPKKTKQKKKKSGRDAINAQVQGTSLTYSYLSHRFNFFLYHTSQHKLLDHH